MLSYFPSLNYCYLDYGKPTIVQDVINNCKELKCVRFNLHCHPSLHSSTYNHNLQQLCICFSANYDVPDDFMTSVSAHGRLVHVVTEVETLTAEV